MKRRFGSFTRREFLRNSGMLAAGLAGRQTNVPTTGIIARPLLDLNSLDKFVDSLPIPGIIRPKGTRPSPENPARVVPHYRLAMRQFMSKVHRDVKPTRLWGFEESSPGPTIETRSSEALLVEWANELPKAHFLPIDHTVHGAKRTSPPSG
jgi:spore coat protein A